MTERCTCGRLVNAGRTAGSGGNSRCLICQTAAIMRTFRDPMTARYRVQEARKKQRKATHGA